MSFRLYERHINIPLEEFCAAIRVPYTGSLDRSRSHNSSFEEFYHSLCVGEVRDLQRGKLTSIQYPSVHYFAIFISRCLLPKGNPTNTCAPDMCVLHSALTGDRSFNLGAIIARRIHENRQSGAFYYGIYTTLLAEHFRIPIRDSIDHQLPNDRLDFFTMPAPMLFDFQTKRRWFIALEDITAYQAHLEEQGRLLHAAWEVNAARRSSYHHSYYPDFQPWG